MSAAAAASQPHLIFALIDDWGWYGAGFKGNGLVKTPFIDGLVRQGAELERHYTFKFCSPTRRSFLSGRLPPHSGQENSAAATVDLSMTTIADKMKQAGYATGYSGKWHAGHQIVAQIPKSRGFDTSLGYFNGACDHYTQRDGEDGCPNTCDIWDTDRPGYGKNGTYGDFMYVGRAVETIMLHDPSTPLFYYLAMQAAHSPMEVPKQYQDLYDATTPNVIEYAFSSLIDEGIRNVTLALMQKGMWENTLLVVSSDNGGPAFSDQHAASNFPLRGGKYTYFEGGIRTTAFVTGGLLPRAMWGKNISAPVHVCDWYATFSRLAGVDPADDQEGVPPIDSIDQWPLLSGSSQALRTEVFIGDGCLVQGKYKLITTGAGTANWTGPLFPRVPSTGPGTIHCSKKAPCLFDVVADPSERRDLAAELPEVVASMQARVEELYKGRFEGRKPNVTKADVCNASYRSGGYITPADWESPGLAGGIVV